MENEPSAETSEASVSLKEIIDTLDTWVRTVQPGEIEWNDNVEDLWRTTHDLLTQAATQRDYGQTVIEVLGECAESYFSKLTSNAAEQEMRREVAEAIEWLRVLFR